MIELHDEREPEYRGLIDRAQPLSTAVAPQAQIQSAEPTPNNIDTSPPIIVQPETDGNAGAPTGEPSKPPLVDTGLDNVVTDENGNVTVLDSDGNVVGGGTAYHQPQTTAPTTSSTGELPPFIPAEREAQQPSYTPQAPVETGKGTVYQGKTYSGKSESDILGASQKGLISMLEQDNPYMQLARKQGARLAESRGLGGSSLRERASQGAAIASAMPLVQQAGQLASSERQTAQQATASSQIAAMQSTAQSEIQAANRRLSEMQQQYELAVQSGDNAAARQLQSDMAEESTRLAQWQTQSDIALREKLAEDDRTLQRDMQSIDIDYKQWLEGVTFKHQGILQGNQQAAGAYSDFTQAAMNILNNPETSTEQKKASIKALKEALSASLALVESTTGINLGKFLPNAPPTGWGGPDTVGPMQTPDIEYNPAAEPRVDMTEQYYNG